MSVEANKAVVRRWVKATNEHDLDALDDLFTADTFDNVGQRDRVVARLTVKGTHRGSAIPFLRGVPATGRSITWTHHHTFRFADGRIAEHWANRDDLGFLRQVAEP